MTYTYPEMVATLRLVNIHYIIDTTIIFLVVRNFRICALSNFQMYAIQQC